MLSFCGLDCAKCAFNANCKGCTETSGRPFGGGVCPLARCCMDKGQKQCGECRDCTLKKKLIDEFNALGIADMSEVTELYALVGSIVNMQHTLPGGQTAKFWNDENIYLGNQVHKANSDRCYGLAADEKYLMVCEYGENGSDAEIVVFQRRK